MSKKPIEPESAYRPDRNRRHPPIDEDVQVPEQVLRAAALANALVTDEPPAPVSVRKRTRSEPRIALTDGEIDQALQHLDRGDIKVAGPLSATFIELAREGARLIKAHRRGARRDRKKSESVTGRIEAVLQAYRELSPRRQANPTGAQTLEALRQSVIAKLGLNDDTDIISEDTISKDLQRLRPVLRLVRNGVVPAPGPKPVKQGISEKTRQEMEAGKRAVAKSAATNKPSQSDC